MRTKMIKKTNFPDLERLPPHNHFKHFFNWLWNKPRWIFEGFYERKFLKPKIELETLQIELEIKKMELTVVRNEIQELRKQSNKPLRVIK